MGNGGIASLRSSPDAIWASARRAPMAGSETQSAFVSGWSEHWCETRLGSLICGRLAVLWRL